MSSTDGTVAPSRPTSKVVTGTQQLLIAEHLTNTFDGSRYQFKDIDLTVCKGQKLGLVGINGCGKSTLLKVLGGQEQCDSGTVDTPKATEVTYVEQDPDFADGLTVRDVVFAADNPLMRAVRNYQSSAAVIEAAGADADILSKALKDFERASTDMDRIGGWDAETFASQILSRLGIRELQGACLTNLSGGQRKRVALAAAFIQKPDVLLLDEPTNHLDVEAIEWLETLLAERSLTFVCVTHDRYFLENVCNEIIELDTAKLYRYPGNYERFLELKEERMNAEGAARDSARSKMRGELAWMRKQPKARQAKSKARQERFFELKEQAATPEGDQAKRLTLSTSERRLGNTIAYLRGANLAFSKKILHDFTYDFDKGDRIGIVGGNGVGKTSFLNVLMGKQPLDHGEVKTGETVRYGHYEQDGLHIPDDVRVMKFVTDTCAAVEQMEGEEALPAPEEAARRLLHLFQFPNNRWNDVVGRLSGGEQRRLQLLQVLATNPNFLVLDEPTNDLDIVSLQILEDFLLTDFKGCLVIVSHDRFFMDRLAKHLFLFEGDGVVRDFQGTFTEYLDYRRETTRHGGRGKRAETAADRRTDSKAISKGNSDEAGEDSEADIAARRPLSFMERKELGRLEQTINELDDRRRELEVLVEGAQGAGKGYTEIAELMEELHAIEAETDVKMERWMELAE